MHIIEGKYNITVVEKQYMYSYISINNNKCLR